MNDEELKYYKALQPVFKEKMGGWQRGDRYIIPDEADNPILHYSDLCDSCDYEVENCDAIRLPLPIDPVNPERGLWGMIEWEFWTVTVNNDGSLEMENICDGTVVIDRPTIALLEVLAHQEE